MKKTRKEIKRSRLDKISRLSVAAATAAKKPGRNQCRRITCVLAQGRAVSGCCSRDLDQAKTLSKNLISSLARIHSQNSIVRQDGTRCPSYVRRARQDFVLNRLGSLVISSRTNVYNTRSNTSQFKYGVHFNFCHKFLLRYAFKKCFK